jgi:hypothetical protein
MREAFITFWKDMWESQKETNRFLKKHCISFPVLVIVGSVIGCVLPCAIVKVKDFIETKKEKSEEEES